MSWAEKEPEELERKIQRLRKYRADFDLDRDFVYGIWNADESQVLGGTGLLARVGEGAREIGYWIHAQHLRCGYATEAVAALTRIAFEVDGVDRVEIHCDPRNEPSVAIPRKLGYRHDATLRRRGNAPMGMSRDTMIWSMFRDEYCETPSAVVEVKAFDAIGRQLL